MCARPPNRHSLWALHPAALVSSTPALIVWPIYVSNPSGLYLCLYCLLALLQTAEQATWKRDPASFKRRLWGTNFMRVLNSLLFGPCGKDPKTQGPYTNTAHASSPDPQAGVSRPPCPWLSWAAWVTVWH